MDVATDSECEGRISVNFSRISTIVHPISSARTATELRNPIFPCLSKYCIRNLNNCIQTHLESVFIIFFNNFYNLNSQIRVFFISCIFFLFFHFLSLTTYLVTPSHPLSFTSDQRGFIGMEKIIFHCQNKQEIKQRT